MVRRQRPDGKGEKGRRRWMAVTWVQIGDDVLMPTRSGALRRGDDADDRTQSRKEGGVDDFGQQGRRRRRATEQAAGWAQTGVALGAGRHSGSQATAQGAGWLAAAGCSGGGGWRGRAPGGAGAGRRGNGRN
ncbi:hypothetical protein E2562_032392 [Oryza meyeriana var. granulata]|uniref:DUF834 domain-containing protein n=1 Tax=Oryza meyeriana var. granulata TaxID=110450 RepID=A0A6G1CBR4_9ORYZ|nr:hypothetical protein E2562_032392 [Oryza meyeriana var. granulata]